MTDERNPGERGMSRQNYYDFRDRNEVFDELTVEGWSSVSLAGSEGEPQRVTAGIVAGNYFSTLGVTPAVGRGFLPDEDRVEGGHAARRRVAVWKRNRSGYVRHGARDSVDVGAGGELRACPPRDSYRAHHRATLRSLSYSDI